MSERRIVALDERTGEFTVSAHAAPDVPFAQRVANLRAEAMEHLPGDGPVLGQVAQLRCDGCGATIELNPRAAVMPESWTTTEGGDFCPRCA